MYLPTCLPIYIPIYLSIWKPCSRARMSPSDATSQWLIYIEWDTGTDGGQRGGGCSARLQQSCWRNRGEVRRKYSSTRRRNSFSLHVYSWQSLRNIALLWVYKQGLRTLSKSAQYQTTNTALEIRVYTKEYLFRSQGAQKTKIHNYVSNQYTLAVLTTISLYSNGMCKTIFVHVPTDTLRRVSLSVCSASRLVPLTGIKSIICDNASNSEEPLSHRYATVGITDDVRIIKTRFIKFPGVA